MTADTMWPAPLSSGYYDFPATVDGTLKLWTPTSLSFLKLLLLGIL